jgi:hypothetical protein
MKKPVILLVEHDDVQRNQLQSLLLRQAFEVIALPEAEGDLSRVTAETGSRSADC